MQGRELVQWLQRVYDVLLEYQTTPAPEPPEPPEPPEVPTSHNQLTENGGTNSHATIADHLAAATAHGRSSPLVGVTDVQSLANKVIDALNNTITNLRHGTEVDNPTTAHGTSSAVVGISDVQTLTNKTLSALLNTIIGLRHGTEVDNPTVAHGTSSAIVGVADVQTLTNKTLSATGNTITGLRHGTEVDNPSAAHGVGEIVGTDEVQVLKNKSIYGQYNTVRNMRHGTEVDNPLAAHGAEGAIVGTSNVQVLLNKIYIHRTISVMGDYTMSAMGPLYVIAQNATATITLPIVNSQFIGLEVTVDNKSAGNITVAVQADATSIEGETTQTLPYDCAMTMRFDGNSWRIV